MTVNNYVKAVRMSKGLATDEGAPVRFQLLGIWFFDEDDTAEMDAAIDKARRTATGKYDILSAWRPARGLHIGERYIYGCPAHGVRPCAHCGTHEMTVR